MKLVIYDPLPAYLFTWWWFLFFFLLLVQTFVFGLIFSMHSFWYFSYTLVYFMYGSTGPHRETFSYEITLRLVLLCRSNLNLTPHFKLEVRETIKYVYPVLRPSWGLALDDWNGAFMVSAGRATCPIVHTLRFLRCCLDSALCAFALLPRSRTCRGWTAVACIACGRPYSRRDYISELAKSRTLCVCLSLYIYGGSFLYS